MVAAGNPSRSFVHPVARHRVSQLDVLHRNNLSLLSDSVGCATRQNACKTEVLLTNVECLGF